MYQGSTALFDRGIITSLLLAVYTMFFSRLASRSNLILLNPVGRDINLNNKLSFTIEQKEPVLDLTPEVFVLYCMEDLQKSGKDNK